jgi:EmrB/QacA subfamily drug resistance transporter
VATAYLLTSTASTPVLGKLSDLYGRKRLYRVAVVALAVGSLMGGFARSMPELVVSRAVQGIGGGGLMALAWAIIADLVPPRERSRQIGRMTAVYAVSSVFGPLIGGFVVENWSWRWIFFVNVPLCIVFIVKVGAALDLPFARREVRVDFLGSALLVAGVTSIVLSVSWSGPTNGWTSPPTLLFGALAIVLAAAFLLCEQRAAEPIIPLRLFSSPVIRICTVTGCSSMVLMSLATAFMPLFLQAVTGASPTQAGLLLLPNVIGMTAAATMGGRFTKRTGLYKPLIVFGTVLGFVSILSFTQLGTTPVRVGFGLLALLLAGAATGFSQPPSTTAMQSAADPRDMGAISSTTICLRNLSATLGLALMGSLFSSRVKEHLAPELIRAPRTIRSLEQPLREQALGHLAGAITSVYRAAIPVAVLGVAAALLIRPQPLREQSGLALIADDATPVPDPA